jgi:cell division protein FtsQ
MSRADEIARERRERERRERLRRRAAAPPRARRPERTARVPEPAPTVARERHEGLVAWLAHSVASVPAGILAVLRGFALEVVAVFAGIGRTMLRLVPGGSRIVGAGGVAIERARDLVPATAAARDDATAAPAGRRRTEAQLRARARRRELLRTRLRLVVAVLTLVLLIAGWVLVPRSQVFRIRHVEVTGAGSVSDLEVRERVDSLLEGKTVFTVDDDALAAKVEELPFVRKARVVRHLPGGLELQLTEYRPLALGHGDGAYWLISRDGRLLAKAHHAEWEGRVPTVALEGSHLRAGMRIADEPGLRLLAELTPNSTLQIQSIKVKDYQVTAVLDGDVELRLGRPEHFSQKLLVADKMQHYARRKDISLLYIDVTVPSRPAICATTWIACNLPREDTIATGASADVDATDVTTTPDERGGDAALVDAATGTQ